MSWRRGWFDKVILALNKFHNDTVYVDLHLSDAQDIGGHLVNCTATVQIISNEQVEKETDAVHLKHFADSIQENTYPKYKNIITVKDYIITKTKNGKLEGDWQSENIDTALVSYFYDLLSDKKKGNYFMSIRLEEKQKETNKDVFEIEKRDYNAFVFYKGEKGKPEEKYW